MASLKVQCASATPSAPPKETVMVFARAVPVASDPARHPTTASL